MTDLIEVKTADLAGHALDWAVAQAEGLEVFLVGPQYNVPWRVFWKKRGEVLVRDVLYNPHEDWALAGPLIDKHMVSLHCPQSTDDVWAGWVITDKGEFCQAGDSAPISACRAIVAAKLGNTVNMPKELMQ
ncbi:phage protein NinX family protein [Pseudomonas sichuanensis]|uniref:phage protein NinX family protein n=1 Tax=Pseudomonas sichuanensis TaxID=2213015 RepID=UPI000DA6C4DA|nr:phage protein NinX family protein [Pseudomonas sichuanensis]